MENHQIITATSADRDQTTSFLTTQWNAPQIVFKGKAYQADTLPAFFVKDGETMIALMTLTVEDGICWIVSLDSLMEGKGIATALIEKAKEYGRENNCKYLRVITTNDNTRAFRFYQKRGFILKAVYPNALELSRKLKPQISLTGVDNIPLRDEIELEMKL